MKTTLLICLLCTSLASASELDCRQVSHYQDYGISDPLYAKIQHRQQLSLDDIVELSRDHVRSSDIMTYLAWSHTEIALSDGDDRTLSREGVSGDVITYLRENPNRTGGFLDIFKSSFIN